MGAEQNTAHGQPSPDQDPPHPFDGQFEPPAEAASKENPRIPMSDIALASIAISLKRLADQIDGGSLDMHFFENAAYQAGVAFERGRR